MNEDEAFIRAIVDNPGDDTPRLVYADWLDDRDDSRGPYLRAEREAVETGDTARLRELAVGLGPVWVARVSRPPVGVCCDHVRFSERGPDTVLAEIEALEQRIRATQTDARERIRGVSEEEPELLTQLDQSQPCRLPDQLRALLLNYNGGRPTPGHFAGVRSRRGNPITVWVDRFLGTVDVTGVVSVWDNNALDVNAAHLWQPDQSDIWEYKLRRLGIAHTGGYDGVLWLVLEGSEAGQIEFAGHDQDFDQASILAPSLAEFLSLLTGGTVHI